MSQTGEYNENSRHVEKIILIIHSVYTVAVIIISETLHWENWISPTILIGMLASWFLFFNKYKSYKFRAVFTASMAMMNFLIYGMNAEDFFATLTMMGALVILLGIYSIPEIVYLALGVSVFLLFYHSFIIQTIVIPDNAKDALRMFFQVCSIFTIEYITYYLVKNQIISNNKFKEIIEQLKQAEKSKDDFMANMSHEIRTPINTVCGMSEMVLMEEVSSRVREDVLDIQLAGRNLLRIVSDILDFSELQSGKMELIAEPYNITSTVNDVMNITVAQLGNKDIELIVDCDANIPNSLLGDEQKIRRVIMNLVDNAVKFTSEGCIQISISARRESYGINLIIEIKDTGIGIKEENLEQLFNNFKQVNMEKNRQKGGIGIGLAISQAIVRQMGGFISVQSVFGEGSHFKVVIPQAVLEDTPIISVENAQSLRVLGYFNLEKFPLAVIREGYHQLITHVVQDLGFAYQSCRNLAEFKRRITVENYTHIFVGWEEYTEDPAYFEEMARELRTVLVLSRKNKLQPDSQTVRIYKPFYVLSIMSALCGERNIQNYNHCNSSYQRFVAPDASVLVVDDNLMNLKVVEGLLRPYKIKVFTAESGKEALEKIERMTYDFVFMDHMMPGMDGVETLHHIRKRVGKYYQTVPIIALTANAIGGAREMFLSEGFQDFVAKPVEISALERVLRKYIPANKIIHEVTSLPTETSMKQIEGKQRLISSPEAVDSFQGLRNAGIEVDKGITFCGGTTADYLDIIRIFYQSAKQKKQEIGAFYQQKDWKNYAILVHALKSNALGIGMVELSRQALALEDAGKSGDESFILANHAEMMHKYNQMLSILEQEEQLQLIETEAEQEIDVEILASVQDLEEITFQQLTDYIDKLAEKLDTFESEEVIAVLQELENFTYQGKELNMMTQSIQKYVEAFDFVGAEEQLNALREQMRENQC